MARAAGAPGKYNVSIADPDAAAAMRAVLAYEARVRGRSLGQACYELVMEAADLPSYPEEVRARLAELDEETARRAVARSLAAADGAE